MHGIEAAERIQETPVFTPVIPTSAFLSGLQFGGDRCFVCMPFDPPEKRFWAKVNKDGPTPEHVPEIGQCWVWLGAKRPSGHGTFMNGKVMSAHRYSYQLHLGPIPEGMMVCHRCDNPSCVRPEHFFLGDQKANMNDCAQKGRACRGEDRPQSKLTEADVLEMRRLYSAGACVTEIHRSFPQVQFGCVEKIVKRLRWKHI